MSEEKSINDLNWLRLKSWRESLAMIFDPPSRRTLLDHISQVDVDIEGDHIIQALFLISWISSKLGWVFLESFYKYDSLIIKFKRNNGEQVLTAINPLPVGNPSIHSGPVSYTHLTLPTTPYV